MFCKFNVNVWVLINYKTTSVVSVMSDLQYYKVNQPVHIQGISQSGITPDKDPTISFQVTRVFNSQLCGFNVLLVCCLEIQTNSHSLSMFVNHSQLRL